MHPTSLPGSAGIGTLGEAAYEFVDWLESAHQTLWQILPIGPTGYGDSPYASFSTFAGNPLMIDLDRLVKKGWADKNDVVPADYIKSEGSVEYGSVVWWKMPVLFKCAAYFLKNANQNDRVAYEAFKNDNAAWLDNYANFTSIKQYYDAEAEKQGVSGVAQMWNAFWPKDLAKCNAKAVSKWNAEHTENIEQIKTIQFFFAEQWFSVKDYANKKGISLIGDIPIFVAADSADVWANQKFFQLDENGTPKKVAGVPPDYFSATGQLWGNPLYDWDAMKKDHYSWWVKRTERMTKLVDVVRIDHFRGFEAYWAVPAGEETAFNGKWKKGPGVDLFNAVKEALGDDMKIFAEDLGIITPEVEALRDECGFPGMKVLQFGFEAWATDAFYPHNFKTTNCICYTGTHDNNTTVGWYEDAKEEARDRVRRYLNCDGGNVSWDFIRLAMSSIAKYAIYPMQDVLRLGSESRMNVPGVLGANWAWRFEKEDIQQWHAIELKKMTQLFNR